MFLSFDIETTGFDPEKDHIIEIAAVRFNEHEILETFATLVNPGGKIPENIKLLTGITDEELAKAPTLNEIKEKFLTFAKSDILIAHNISFDRTFLQSKNIPLADVGYDSCELARILLPNLPSYSLEILTHLLDIGHKDKHRALSDAVATANLLQLLIKKSREIPEEKREKILAVLTKSNWSMKHFFQNIFKGTSEKHYFGNKILPFEPAGRQTDETRNNDEAVIKAESHQEIREDISEMQTILIEDENYSAKNWLTAKKHKKIIMAIDKTSPLWEDENIEKMLPPSQYICLNRLKTYLEKPFFENSETTLLLKIILRENELKKGTRQELDVFQEEHAHFQSIEAEEPHCSKCAENRCFFTRLQNDLKNYEGPILISYETILTKTCLLPQKPVAIDQADLFAENAAFILTNPYKLSTLENITKSEILDKEMREKIFSKLGIFFGLCGMFVEKFSDSQGGYKKIVIEKSHRSAVEWKNIQNALENLLTIVESSEAATKLTAMIKKLKNDWSDEQNTLWIAQGWDLVIKYAPKNIPATIQKALTHFPSITYISQNMTVQNTPPRQRSLFDTEDNTSENDFSFIKKLLGLPDNIPSKKIPYENPEKIPLFIAEKLPEPNAPGNFKQTLTYIQKILENTTENVFLLMNSGQSIEMFHEAFLSLSRKTVLLSQNQSGGFGKIAHQYRHATSQTFIIGGIQLFEKIMNMRGKTTKILIIHRLPFQPPDDPMTQEIQKTCDNPFTEYTIPSATIKLKRLIGKYASDDFSGKTICLLDSRLKKRDYGETILASLQSFVEISTH